MAVNQKQLASRLLGGLLLSVALYYAVWGGEYSAFDLRRLRREQLDATARLEVTEQQVDSLRRVATQLDRDPATIEQVARERFGMVRDGELLYRFVGTRPARVAVQPPPSAP